MKTYEDGRITVGLRTMPLRTLAVSDRAIPAGACMHLYVVTTLTRDHALVALHGEADILTVPIIQQAFRNAALHAQHRDMTVDLCGLRFIDSTGAQPLVDVDRSLREHGKRLSLACLPSATRRMLHRIRLGGYFPVLPNGVPEGICPWASKPIIGVRRNCTPSSDVCFVDYLA
ncbi:STAS domain-containing protein [Streptomyces sp. NPDC059176]|uniref:STAS domain-containing protein n=1 Tax=unclassified Streptomyces TaxID=2593676 RepID=UPI0036B37763